MALITFYLLLATPAPARKGWQHWNVILLNGPISDHLKVLIFVTVIFILVEVQ